MLVKLDSEDFGGKKKNKQSKSHIKLQKNSEVG